MAGKARKRLPKSKPVGDSHTGTVSGSAEGTVSRYMEKPAGASSETEKIHPPGFKGGGAILSAAEPAVMIQSGPLDETVLAQSKLDLLEIRDEIEETLVQMEQRDTQGIAAPDQKEAIEEPSRLIAKNAEPPVSGQSAQSTAAAPAGLSAIDSAEEEAWKSLETLRSKIASRKPSPKLFQWRRILIFALAAVVLALVAGGLYFAYWKKIQPVQEIHGQVPDIKTQHVQDSEKHTSGAMPLENAAPAQKAKDPAPPSSAKKSRSSQKNLAASAIVGKRSDETPAAGERSEEKPVTEQRFEEKTSTTSESPVPNLETAASGLPTVSRPLRWVEVTAEPPESNPKAKEQPAQQAPVTATAGASPAPAAQLSKSVSSPEPAASRPPAGNTPSPSRSEPRTSESSSPHQP